MRILIAEDEYDLNYTLTKWLKSDGFIVDSVDNGQDALSYATTVIYDVVILDVMMPKMDGFTVLKRLRESGRNVPVLFLTARDSIEDKVYGLDLGAGDYLVKPFAYKELVARIRAAVRKRDGVASNTYRVGNLSLDLSTYTVKNSDTEVFLSQKEFALLTYLIRHAGQVLTREQILDNVWSWDYAGGTNLVDVYIRLLRKKIDQPFQTNYLQTVRGVGYCLREEK